MARGSFGFGFVAVSWLLVALPVGAGDGVREINQSCAAVGCWPGDSPGLPVEIVETGSYRLTGGLLIDANTTAIVVTADNVSIDLNGFTIRGPAQVTIEPDGTLVCSSPGTGHAIFAPLAPRTEVRNGFVAGISGPEAV